MISTRAVRQPACKKVGRPWAILMRFVVLVSPCRQTPAQYDRFLSHSFRLIIHCSSNHSLNPAQQVSFLNSEVMLRSPFFWNVAPRCWVIHTRRFETASLDSKTLMNHVVLKRRTPTTQRRSATSQKKDLK